MKIDEDVVAVLTRQHRQLESQLKGLLDAAEAADPVASGMMLAAAGDELSVHILAEEHIVYPAVLAARTEGILLESLEEHLSLKRLLADLLALAPQDTTFLPKCKVLEEQARHHHKEEEEHLFPAMRRLLDEPSRRALGASVVAHEHALHAKGAPRERVLNETAAAAPLV
ncbi:MULTISPECIES: hemerythrin domain-containing protein [unclassified Roseateles]|uniref:hemerythrin domain-containing protein n=1 Tax=unclassified Roseateles TaxID=2626991 RepID=UPI0006FBF97C|nr:MULTISPECIES: hemerythrin domain-containing protein [unclassified Roseateles]KQW52029.1 hypothetical protein ASC81_05370 [Pelomonas sp. Root405]KRA78263.1 hypothetical protein ASD88_05375 [Pelomonas sp. Root662]